MRYFIEACREVFWKYEKLYGDKWFHCLIIYLLLDSAWKIYQNPAETWAMTQKNIINPWYYIPLGLMIFLWVTGVTLLLVNKYYFSPLQKKQLDFLKSMKKSVAKSVEETKLMQKNEIPSDEDIDKYYKMYLIKFQEDNKDRWNTEEPMSFDHWEKCAKDDFEEEQFGRVKWAFMIAMTSDSFMFDPATGQSTMIRFRDYDEMLEQDDYKDLINRQLDIE